MCVCGDVVGVVCLWASVTDGQLLRCARICWEGRLVSLTAFHTMGLTEGQIGFPCLFGS